MLGLVMDCDLGDNMEPRLILCMVLMADGTTGAATKLPPLGDLKYIGIQIFIITS